MTDKDRVIEIQRSDDDQNVFSQTLSGIVRDRRRGLTGSAEPATSNGVYVMVRRELRSEIIEVVGGSSEARKKNHRSACAAPIEDFEVDTVLHRNCSDHRKRGRGPLLCVKRGRHCDRKHRQEHEDSSGVGEEGRIAADGTEGAHWRINTPGKEFFGSELQVAGAGKAAGHVFKYKEGRKSGSRVARMPTSQNRDMGRPILWTIEILSPSRCPVLDDEERLWTVLEGGPLDMSQIIRNKFVLILADDVLFQVGIR
jgi:hypothetical protein